MRVALGRLEDTCWTTLNRREIQRMISTMCFSRIAIPTILVDAQMKMENRYLLRRAT